jgi:hypothetical protein
VIVDSKRFIGGIISKIYTGIITIVIYVNEIIFNSGIITGADIDTFFHKREIEAGIRNKFFD